MVFEHFTPDARTAVVIAQELARRYRQPRISPIHLAMGAIGADGPEVLAVLATVGTTVSAVTEHLSRIVDVGTVDLEGHIPFSEHGKDAIRATVATTADLGQTRVTALHLVLGCLRASSAAASAEALAEAGVTEPVVVAALSALPGGDGIHFSGVEPI